MMLHIRQLRHTLDTASVIFRGRRQKGDIYYTNPVYSVYVVVVYICLPGVYLLLLWIAFVWNRLSESWSIAGHACLTWMTRIISWITYSIHQPGAMTSLLNIQSIITQTYSSADSASLLQIDKQKSICSRAALPIELILSSEAHTVIHHSGRPNKYPKYHQYDVGGVYEWMQHMVYSHCRPNTGRSESDTVELEAPLRVSSQTL